jgi:hypothetical protein
MATALLLVAARPAAAQRIPFERTFGVGTEPVLDVETIRGAIEVSVGEPGQVRVMGTATVRVGLAVPANAIELAKKVAANPPVQQLGATFRLRPPEEGEQQRAMTLSYRVLVPRGTHVRSRTDSGETTIQGVAGPVVVHTQSSVIALRDLGGSAEVTTGSGAVDVDGVSGDLTVRTQSSGITLRGVSAGLRVRTQSGGVTAGLRGNGDVDVETSSSAIDLTGVNGALLATSRSGRIRAGGVPAAEWRVTNGSGRVDLSIAPKAPFALEAATDSASIKLEGVSLRGTTSKWRASGTVGEGGPTVHVNTRSGSITIRTP